MKARKGPLQNRRESDIGRGVVAEVKGLPQIEDCRVGPLLPAGSRVSARRGDSQRETSEKSVRTAAVTLNQIHRAWQSEGEMMQEIDRPRVREVEHGA